MIQYMLLFQIMLCMFSIFTSFTNAITQLKHTWLFICKLKFQYAQVGANLTQYVYILSISTSYTNAITQLKHTWLFNIIILSVAQLQPGGTDFICSPPLKFTAYRDARCFTVGQNHSRIASGSTFLCIECRLYQFKWTPKT